MYLKFVGNCWVSRFNQLFRCLINYRLNSILYSKQRNNNLHTLWCGILLSLAYLMRLKRTAMTLTHHETYVFVKYVLVCNIYYIRKQKQSKQLDTHGYNKRVFLICAPIWICAFCRPNGIRRIFTDMEVQFSFFRQLVFCLLLQ